MCISICHLILNSINFLCNCYIFDKDNGSIDEIQPILNKKYKTDDNFDFKSEINIENPIESDLSITSSNDTICSLLTSSNDTICSENSFSEHIVSEKFNENLSENNCGHLSENNCGHLSENNCGHLSENETTNEYTSDEDCLFEF